MPISFPNRASAVARTHQYSAHIRFLTGTNDPRREKIHIENRPTFSTRVRRKKNGARLKYGTLNGTLRRQNADRI